MCAYDKQAYLLPIDMPRSEYPTSDFNFELPKMTEVLPREAYLLPIDMPRSEYPTNDFIEKKLIEAQTKVEVI